MNNFMKIDRKISDFWVKYERCISKHSYFEVTRIQVLQKNLALRCFVWVTSIHLLNTEVTYPIS
jgi:hypothetical protein